MQSTIRSLPPALIKRIKDHLRTQSIQGESGWNSANEEEDSLTGDFFGHLRIHDQECEGWTWSVDYNKFRGRGPKPLENEIGADGIITLQIEKDGKQEQKSMIFQAKKYGNERINNQLEKMHNTLPGGNMVIIYSEDGYHAITGSEYNSSRQQYSRVGDYLVDTFIECHNGVWGAYYDRGRRKLITPTVNFMKVDLKHRLLVKVEDNEA